jgi:GTP cyclohydrolase I
MTMSDMAPMVLVDEYRRSRFDDAERRDCARHAPIDLDAAERAVADLLVALGQDLDTEDLHGTPRRVAATLAELLTPEPFSMTTFANDERYDEMVVVRDIPFHSLCAHHLLPFMGVAHVAYLPGERIVGLSKLARVVEHFARRPQVQERLTRQVVDALDVRLAPRGVGVVMEATHLCMALRGVSAAGARTITTAVSGVVRDDPATRAEFMTLVGGGVARAGGGH